MCIIDIHYDNEVNFVLNIQNEASDFIETMCMVFYVLTHSGFKVGKEDIKGKGGRGRL